MAKRFTMIIVLISLIILIGAGAVVLNLSSCGSNTDRAVETDTTASRSYCIEYASL